MLLHLLFFSFLLTYQHSPRKHTLATPKRITQEIRNWEHPVGAPNSEWVVQDVYRVFDTFKIIYEAGGNIVRCLANRNGHRNTKEGSLKRGGSRVKNRSSKKKNGWNQEREKFSNKKRLS